VLVEFGLHDAPVQEVEQALACFDAHFDTPATVHVNLSLARGLRYYTGLVFEVYDDRDNQIAGGGRYDDLVRALGGRAATPACGFSYGLERLVAALERTRAVPPLADQQRVGVVPVNAEDYPAAARLAMDLRRDGVIAEVDLRFRGLKASLRHADHRGLPLVVVVGEKEREEGLITLRDMRAFEETRIPPSELTATIHHRLQLKA
jgi:histidyl-tRNA synthetase